MADPTGALVAWLKTRPSVTALASTRVFGAELPASEIPNQPRAAVVINPSGGGYLPSGYQRLTDRRVDISCYGATRLQAEALYTAVSVELKHLRRIVAASTLIHWAKVSAAGFNTRDPDTDWPVCVSSWQVLHSETDVS